MVAQNNGLKTQILRGYTQNITTKNATRQCRRFVIKDGHKPTMRISKSVGITMKLKPHDG